MSSTEDLSYTLIQDMTHTLIKVSKNTGPNKLSSTRVDGIQSEEPKVGERYLFFSKSEEGGIRFVRTSPVTFIIPHQGYLAFQTESGSVYYLTPYKEKRHERAA